MKKIMGIRSRISTTKPVRIITKTQRICWVGEFFLSGPWYVVLTPCGGCDLNNE